MRKSFYVLIVILYSSLSVFSQDENKIYITYGPEAIMSFGLFDDNNNTTGTIMRFTPVFNFMINGNKDFGKHFGLTFGVAVHNSGFILNYSDTTLRYKFRTYNIGISLGVKLGNLDKGYFYIGYEPEFPVGYKEKKYIYMEESSFKEWFSERTPAVYHSVFVGYNFAPGVGVKIKYYFNEFFNRDFIDSNGNQPYKNLKANVLYIAFDFMLFQNNKFAFSKK